MAATLLPMAQVSEMSGSVTLERGALRLSAVAAGEGPTVLLLHGFPDHARSFAPLVDSLARSGYRAVAPSLRGYEPASQPEDGDYGVPSLVEDVVAWVDCLGGERAHLVGHDWGAIIGYAAVTRAPERFASLTTLAVPRLGRLPLAALRLLPVQARNSWYAMFFQVPRLPELVLSRSDWRLIRRLWQDWSPGLELGPHEWASLRATMAAPGVKAAMVEYYRQNLRRAAHLMGDGPVRVPTLAITGDRDGCIDTRLYEYAMREGDFPSGLQVKRLSGVGHFVHLEAPEVVEHLLLDWLKRNPGG